MCHSKFSFESTRKNSNIFLYGAFFLVLSTKCLSKALTSRNLSCFCCALGESISTPCYEKFTRAFFLLANKSQPTRQNYIPKTSWGRPQKTSWRPQDVPYGPICMVLHSGTPLGRTQDVSLNIIHKMFFYGFFSYFSWLQLYIRHCTVKVI